MRKQKLACQCLRVTFFFCRGGVTASPTCLCGCVSIYIEMYTVYRLQVTLSHTAFPPASTATGRNCHVVGREKLPRPRSAGRRWSCTVLGIWLMCCTRADQNHSRCKGFVPSLDASVKGQSPAIVGLTEPRDLWLFALKKNKPVHSHSIQATVLRSSS